MSIKVVAVGNAFDGLKFYGPFFNSEDASDFTDTLSRGAEWSIIPIHAPYRSAYAALPGAEWDEPIGLFAADVRDEEPPEEVLVTLWADGTAEIATREHSSQSWGPPTKMEQKESR